MKYLYLNIMSCDLFVISVIYWECREVFIIWKWSFFIIWKWSFIAFLGGIYTLSVLSPKISSLVAENSVLVSLLGTSSVFDPFELEFDHIGFQKKLQYQFGKYTPFLKKHPNFSHCPNFYPKTHSSKTKNMYMKWAQLRATHLL